MEMEKVIKVSDRRMKEETVIEVELGYMFG